MSPTIINSFGFGGGGGGGDLPYTTGLWAHYKRQTGWWQDTAGTTAASANADPIRRWDDSSGNGRNATQGGASSLVPAVDTAGPNGLSVVRFSVVDPSAGNYWTLPDMTALTAAEMFVVIKLANDPPAAAARTGFHCLSADGTNSTHFPWTDGTIYDSFGTNSRKSTVNPTPALTSWRRYNVYSGANRWRNFLDNTALIAEITTNTVGFAFNHRFGGSLGDPPGFSIDGWVGEIILYDHILATTNRDNVDGYLATAFGL